MASDKHSRRSGPTWVTLAAIESVVLCLAVAGMWVRSQTRWESIGRAAKEGWHVEARSTGGYLVLSAARPCPFDLPLSLMSQPLATMIRTRSAAVAASDGSYWTIPSSGPDGRLLTLGGPATTGTVIEWWKIQVAAALVAVAAASLEIRQRRRQWRRRREGLCAVCRYDLRASADRCPECGTALTSAPAPAA